MRRVSKTTISKKASGKQKCAIFFSTKKYAFDLSWIVDEKSR